MVGEEGMRPGTWMTRHPLLLLPHSGLPLNAANEGVDAVQCNNMRALTCCWQPHLVDTADTRRKAPARVAMCRLEAAAVDSHMAKASVLETMYT